MKRISTKRKVKYIKYSDGGTNQVDPENPGMTGMMKSKIATEAHYGNPSALRMVSPNPSIYTWTGEEKDWDGNQAAPAGNTGTHYMGSFGNQARPGLQEVDGKMQYFQNPPYNSKENFNFSRPEDAEYFAEHYKEVAPMMRNYPRYPDGGSTDIVTPSQEPMDVYMTKLGVLKSEQERVNQVRNNIVPTAQKIDNNLNPQTLLRGAPKEGNFCNAYTGECYNRAGLTTAQDFLLNGRTVKAGSSMPMIPGNLQQESVLNQEGFVQVPLSEVQPGDNIKKQYYSKGLPWQGPVNSNAQPHWISGHSMIYKGPGANNTQEVYNSPGDRNTFEKRTFQSKDWVGNINNPKEQDSRLIAYRYVGNIPELEKQTLEARKTSLDNSKPLQSININYNNKPQELQLKTPNFKALFAEQRQNINNSKMSAKKKAEMLLSIDQREKEQLGMYQSNEQPTTINQTIQSNQYKYGGYNTSSINNNIISKNNKPCCDEKGNLKKKRGLPYTQFAIGGKVDTDPNGNEITSEADYNSGMINYMANGGMIKRADGSYSKRGLWDNIRANAGSGKTPTAKMLKQEAKINKMAMGGYMMYGNGGTNNPGFDALPEEVQQNILANMAMGGQMNNPMFANGGKLPQDILESRLESHMSTNEVNNYLDKYGEGGYVVKRSSDRKGKTHVVIGPDGTKKYFGDPNMGQKEDSKNGKEAFYARHKTNLANNPYFRAYAKKTWAMGGMNMEQEIDPKPATSSTKTFNNIVPLVDAKTGKPNWDNYYSTLNKMGTNVNSTNPEAKQTPAQSAINHYIGQGIVPQIKTYQGPLNIGLANKYGEAYNPTTGPTTNQFLDSTEGAAALGSTEAYQDFLNNTKAYNAYRGKTQIPGTNTTGTSDPNAEMYGARYYNMFTPGYTAPLLQKALGGQFAMGGMTMKQGIIHAPEMGGYFRKK